MAELAEIEQETYVGAYLTLLSELQGNLKRHLRSPPFAMRPKMHEFVLEPT